LAEKKKANCRRQLDFLSFGYSPTRDHGCDAGAAVISAIFHTQQKMVES